MLHDGVVVVIVFTEEDGDIIRIISMRKANKYEEAKYEKEIKDRLGSHQDHEG
jgi:uncharacterized DUF497 family protein